jgi:hypothetical protein
VLRQIDHIQSSALAATTVELIAPILPEELVEPAIQSTASILDDRNRLRALISLRTHLTETQRHDVIIQIETLPSLLDRLIFLDRMMSNSSDNERSEISHLTRSFLPIAVRQYGTAKLMTLVPILILQSDPERFDGALPELCRTPQAARVNFLNVLLRRYGPSIFERVREVVASLRGSRVYQTYFSVLSPPVRPRSRGLGHDESKTPLEWTAYVPLPSGAPSGHEEEIKKGSRPKPVALRERELAGPLLRSRQERIKHFSGRTSWKIASAADPALKPLMHIERVYPDRRRGLLRSDLWKIDEPLAQALKNWLNYKRDDGSKPNSIPPSFGLLTAKEWYALVDRDEGTPTGADVLKAYRRGDPEAAELNRRHAAARRRGEVRSRAQRVRRRKSPELG